MAYAMQKSRLRWQSIRDTGLSPIRYRFGYGWHCYVTPAHVVVIMAKRHRAAGRHTLFDGRDVECATTRYHTTSSVGRLRLVTLNNVIIVTEGDAITWLSATSLVVTALVRVINRMFTHYAAH